MLMKNIPVLLLLSCLFISAVSYTQHDNIQDSFDLKNKKILIVYGGWEGHQPDVFARKIEKWALEKGAVVSVSDSLGVYVQKDFMQGIDLIIQYWTMGTISDDQCEGLLNVIKNGTGLVGCHGGIGDSFRNNPEYQYMVGGQWVTHPGGKIKYEVHISDQEDPITSGVHDFEIGNTEQYYMHVDPNVKVLATTTFSDEHDSWIKGAVMPVVWKKYHNKGRIFYVSIGHNPEDFDHPAVWTMLTRGIDWASKSKYQERELKLYPVYPSN